MELPDLFNEASARWRSLPLPPQGRDAAEAKVLARILDVAEEALADGLLAETTDPDGAPCWTWAPKHRAVDEPAPFVSEEEAGT